MIHLRFLAPCAALLSVALLAACPTEEGENPEEFVSSRAYKGHENDLDINHFVNAWPATVGTRLDDCQTCHTGGTFTWMQGDTLKTASMNACDFCHLVIHPRDPGFDQAQPTSFAETLNPFGVDYLDAGRAPEAFDAIIDEDSDEDGHANGVEIDALASGAISLDMLKPLESVCSTMMRSAIPSRKAAKLSTPSISPRIATTISLILSESSSAMTMSEKPPPSGSRISDHSSPSVTVPAKSTVATVPGVLISRLRSMVSNALNASEPATRVISILSVGVVDENPVTEPMSSSPSRSLAAVFRFVEVIANSPSAMSVLSSSETTTL